MYEVTHAKPIFTMQGDRCGTSAKPTFTIRYGPY